MMQLAVILGMVAIVSCQAPEPRPHKYCCTPRQWEGLQAGIGGIVTEGKGQALTTNSWVAFDRDGRRVYSFTNTTSAMGYSSIKIIQDFKSGYQWVIDVKKRQCVKSKLTQEFNEGCIPDNAKFLGSFYYGALSEELHSKLYSVRVQGSGTLLDVMVTVTQEQCIPVGEALVGSTGNVPLVLTIGFVNITPGIKDPSVFTPPAICKQNATIELPPSHIDPKFHILHI